MFKLHFFGGALLFSASALLGTAANNIAGSRVPVLLELFTSEGCSSCPSADRLLESLDQQQPFPSAELIVLSEHVDYWDGQGWKDPFSSKQYTERQKDYSDRYNLDGPYTPQLVVDGRYGLVGSQAPQVTSTVQKALHERKLAIAISNVARNGRQLTAQVALPAAPTFKGRWILYVALADNRRESHVARGENAGRALTHVAVTRVLQEVGPVDLASASTKEIVLSVPAGMEGTSARIVAFVQDRKSGHVVGVAQQKL
jgi:hypothetical protein